MPADLSLLWAYAWARAAGWMRPVRLAPAEARTDQPLPPGISVVIPSRNGRELLAAQLPGTAQDLEGIPGEIMVVDNGSGDGTAGWLAAEWPHVEVQVSPEPLGFARAVNRGLARARYAHVCLLNNDMLTEPGFFAALRGAFDEVPDLFCATAQIRFPAGVRREETGKAVMRQDAPEDFPIRCDVPVEGEDLTWVLYGSGGCSLYDAQKLRELGGLDEAYDPAYVEDLDLGYRAWLRGWPSVYVAGAVVEHRHRATTSRYYSERQLAELVEINYLKFLARAVASPKVFRHLWAQALGRLRANRDEVLRQAAAIARQGGPPPAGAETEELLLALTNGSVACFPGRAPMAAQPKVVASQSLCNAGAGSILVAMVDRLQTPPPEILEAYALVVLVWRGSATPESSFRAALEQSRRRARL